MPSHRQDLTVTQCLTARFGSIQPNWSVSMAPHCWWWFKQEIPSHLMACGAAWSVALLWISLVFLWPLSNWLPFIALLATLDANCQLTKSLWFCLFFVAVLIQFMSYILPGKHTDLFNFLLGFLLLCSGFFPVATLRCQSVSGLSDRLGVCRAAVPLTSPKTASAAVTVKEVDVFTGETKGHNQLHQLHFENLL